MIKLRTAVVHSCLQWSQMIFLIKISCIRSIVLFFHRIINSFNVIYRFLSWLQSFILVLKIIKTYESLCLFVFTTPLRNREYNICSFLAKYYVEPFQRDVINLQDLRKIRSLLCKVNIFNISSTLKYQLK